VIVISLLRYPGGKTKLLPILKEYISALGFKNGDTWYEPFVGGGSVALNIACRYPHSSLYLNDLDQEIAALWRVISGNKEAFDTLYHMIDLTPTIENFNYLRGREPTTDYERAFYAVYFNHTTFSGIRTSGPIGGAGQKSKWSISCRYNAKKIQKDLLSARKLLQGRTRVSDIDGIDFVRAINGFLYIDPPYFHKGESLYRHTIDHSALAEVLKRKDNWLLSYDAADEVKQLYDFANIDEVPARYSIAGKKYKWAGKKEYIITPKMVKYQSKLVVE
jgi:DNA adenine methylase